MNARKDACGALLARFHSQHECTERCMQSTSCKVPFPTCPWCSAIYRWVCYLRECAFLKHCLLG
jgi:hypothetical protein